MKVVHVHLNEDQGIIYGVKVASSFMRRIIRL